MILSTQKYKYFLAFVVNGSIELSPFKWMIPLAKLFQEKNFYVLFLLGPYALGKKDDLDWKNVVIFQSPEDIKNLTYVDIFVCFGYEQYEFPLNSYAIGFAHGFLYTSKFLDIAYYLYHMQLYDVVALPVHMKYARQDITKLFTGFYQPQTLSRSSKDFYLLECGQPSLGYLQKKINLSPT